MTLATWLPAFGRPNRADLSEQLPGGAQTTSPDEGPPRTRLRLSLTGAEARWSIVMAPDTKARFERWWREDLKRGALPFLAPDWARDGWPLLTPDGTPLLTPDGTPLLVSAWRIHMASAATRPEWRVLGRSTSWTLSLTVIVMP